MYARFSHFWHPKALKRQNKFQNGHFSIFSFFKFFFKSRSIRQGVSKILKILEISLVGNSASPLRDTSTETVPPELLGGRELVETAPPSLAGVKILAISLDLLNIFQLITNVYKTFQFPLQVTIPY